MGGWLSSITRLCYKVEQASEDRTEATASRAEFGCSQHRSSHLQLEMNLCSGSLSRMLVMPRPLELEGQAWGQQEGYV